MRPVVLAAGAALLLVTASAQAQEGTGCAAFKWHVDREVTAFAGDAQPTVSAGAQIPGVMEAVKLDLAKQEGQTFEIPPSRPPKHNPAYAGVFTIVPFQVAGPYNVTISDEAWIDVIQGGKILHQSGFTGAKGCQAVRKSVQFNLVAGPATVMITDAANPTLKLEVLPPPVN